MPALNPAAPAPAVVEDIVRAYAGRGSECAFANLKLLARVVGAVYDDALAPVDLSAAQLALLWAVVATEPVEYSRLAAITRTDATTLSRTVARLQAEGLLAVRHGEDRRVRLIRTTPAGRRRYAAAMPHWEEAQRRAAAFLPLPDLRALARRARKSTAVAK